MGLSLARVDVLIGQGWIDPKQRIVTAVTLTLLLRTLGLALSFTRWMETSGCLSLDQGRLDDPMHWQFPWNSAASLSKRLFPAEGLPEEQRRALLSSARNHVAAANHLFRRLGMSQLSPIGMPLRMVHGDVQSGLAAFVRWGSRYPNPVLVVINLSPLQAASGAGYEIDLKAAGWPAAHHPASLNALTRPLWGEHQEPLLLTHRSGMPGRYQLNRPLHGYESALFEVPVHGC